MDDLPVQPGIYALILKLNESKTITVGRLGALEMSAGFYVYSGSARGPGGLRGRLSRHIWRQGKFHWHIDYLAVHAVVQGYAYYVLGDKEEVAITTECAWSQALISMPGAVIPALKFGASDCRSGCPAHLVHYPESSFLISLPEVLNPAADRGVFRFRVFR
jgi:Uri superfamily endonuclease